MLNKVQFVEGVGVEENPATDSVHRKVVVDSSSAAPDAYLNNGLVLQVWRRDQMLNPVEA